MKNLFAKIFIGYITVIFILTAIILYFEYSIIKENYQNNTIQNLINIDYSLQYAVKPVLVDNNILKLDSLVKVIGSKIKSRITIIDINGVVLADSKANPNTMENHADRFEVSNAIKNGLATSIRHSYTVNKDMLYVALPIEHNNKVIGITRLSIFMDNYQVLYNQLFYPINRIAFLIACLSIILAFVFTRSITKPIKHLVDVVKLVTNGNFDINANVKSNNEIKVLADHINNMIKTIKQLFIQAKQQKEELHNIIASIQEGLVVINSQEQILLSNVSFQKIANNNQVQGKFIWEVIRDTEIYKLIKKMQNSNINISSEVFYNEEHFICSINHINPNKELVLIFHNISMLKKFENIKKDFVANVSHELRTPLTVIKGYVETLEDVIDDKNAKYIKIIKNHTERLINIVQDLLTVSQLEDKKFILSYTKIELKEFIDKLIFTFEQKIQEKKLLLGYEIEENLPVFKADEYKLEQMFINLIDNAIKYTDSGSIIINISKKEQYLYIVIKDTGLGIPDKDIERIFERFYTVDKSRSRIASGTGLGLSIVKHIVLLHKGKIEVKSKVGNGSSFVISLPFNNDDE